MLFHCCLIQIFFFLLQDMLLKKIPDWHSIDMIAADLCKTHPDMVACINHNRIPAVNHTLIFYRRPDQNICVCIIDLKTDNVLTLIIHRNAARDKNLALLYPVARFHFGHAVSCHDRSDRSRFVCDDIRPFCRSLHRFRLLILLDLDKKFRPLKINRCPRHIRKRLSKPLFFLITVNAAFFHSVVNRLLL